jgi:hypothetical protein
MSPQNSNTTSNLAASQQTPNHMSRTQKPSVKYQDPPLYDLKLSLRDREGSSRIPSLPGAIVAALNRGPFLNAVRAAKFENNILHISLTDMDKEGLFRDHADHLNAIFDLEFKIIEDYVFHVEGGDISDSLETLSDNNQVRVVDTFKRGSSWYFAVATLQDALSILRVGKLCAQSLEFRCK